MDGKRCSLPRRGLSMLGLPFHPKFFQPNRVPVTNSQPLLVNMQAIANINPSHFHIVAASVVEEQFKLRQQIRALINDVDARASARAVSQLAMLRRMSVVAELPRYLNALIESTEDIQTSTRARSQLRTTTTSILPPQLSDLWPEIFRHLLRKNIWLRQRLEKVTRIFTRPSCVSVMMAAAGMYASGESATWCDMVAAGLRDKVELQLLMEVMMSNIHGRWYFPTKQFHDSFSLVAAIRGWQLPRVRIWAHTNRSLHHHFTTAGFCVLELSQPFYPPQIVASASMFCAQTEINRFVVDDLVSSAWN